MKFQVQGGFDRPTDRSTSRSDSNFDSHVEIQVDQKHTRNMFSAMICSTWIGRNIHVLCVEFSLFLLTFWFDPSPTRFVFGST